MKMYQLYVFCLLIRIAAAAFASTGIQYKDMEKAPEASAKIGTLNDAPKLEHCLIACSRNADCKSIVYDDGRCHLYDTRRASVTLTSGQKAAAEISKEVMHGDLINLCTERGTECTASSTSGGYDCKYAIDGVVGIGSNNEWSSDRQKDGSWINVTFPRMAIVQKIKVWYRCTSQDQNRKVVFEFSDYYTMEETTECSVNTDLTKCPEPTPFGEFILSPPRITKWIRLINYDSCNRGLGSTGCREIMYLGRFISE